MKPFSLLIIFFSCFLLFGGELRSQSCEELIADNRVIGGTHILRSQSQTLVVRGNYTYSMELISDDKGITALVVSKGGIEFNQDDEVIFMDANQTRRSYRFIGMAEINNEGGVPIHSNILQLDMTALQWFSNNLITTIYLKNNISNEMRKYTFTENRLREFNQLAGCFYQALDPTLVVDNGEVGLLIPSSAST
ncbi:MAG: hypothetical protein KDC54_10175, partial [Lewinella sp.]|nr:hypothetical protein [Lewinella sp.]